MTSLAVSRRDLKKAVDRLVRFVPKGAEGGAAGIHLSAYGGRLTLAAGDDASMSVVIPADVSDGGLHVVPATFFVETLKSVKHDPVPMGDNDTGNRIFWMAGRDTTPLPSSEFRPRPTISYDTVIEKGSDVVGSDLKEALKSVLLAAAPAWDLREHRRAVFFSKSHEWLSMVAADEWRMIQRRILVYLPDGTEFVRFGIASDAAHLLMRSVPNDEAVSILVDGANAFFHWYEGGAEYTLVAPLRADSYINLVAEFAEPRESLSSVEVERSELLSFAKEAKEITHGGMMPLVFDAQDNHLSLTAHGTEVTKEADESKASGFARVVKQKMLKKTLFCKSTGYAHRAFNPSFLVDALSVVDETTVTLEFTGKGLQIQTADSLQIIAPMKETGNGITHDNTGLLAQV